MGQKNTSGCSNLSFYSFSGGTRRSEPTPKELHIQMMTLTGDKDDMSVSEVVNINLQGNSSIF